MDSKQHQQQQQQANKNDKNSSSSSSQPRQLYSNQFGHDSNKIIYENNESLSHFEAKANNSADYSSTSSKFFKENNLLYSATTNRLKNKAKLMREKNVCDLTAATAAAAAATTNLTNQASLDASLKNDSTNNINNNKLGNSLSSDLMATTTTTTTTTTTMAAMTLPKESKDTANALPNSSLFIKLNENRTLPNNLSINSTSGIAAKRNSIKIVNKSSGESKSKLQQLNSSNSLLTPSLGQGQSSTHLNSSHFHTTRRESFLYRPDTDADGLVKVAARSASIASDQ